MITKTLLPICGVLLASAPAFSEILSPEAAIQRINSEFSTLPTRGGGSLPQLKYTVETQLQQPSVYVFDKGDDAGYLVVSADDAAAPLLGYCDTGSFDASNIPPELAYWLDAYSRQIEYARSVGASASSTGSPILEGKAAISPLLKSKWNQGDPYNLYCYTIASDGTQTKSVTGCVATSMAQVMYYFKYPEIGQGEISYKHGDSGTYSMNFGAQAFDWNEMLPTYYPDSYTTQQADAVAYLMKACGYSVKMNYEKGESGADGANIGDALIKYFGYDDNIVIRTRRFFTYQDWATMIYDNLSQVGPVVYNGSALDGGHSFVCDGYDGNGYFHFNWGWGGMSDGYYLLDALNPDEYGIGGTAGGYNLGQQIILGISPKTTNIFEHRVMQFGNAEGKISDGKLTLELTDGSDNGLQYVDPLQVTLTFGLEVTNVSDPQQAVQYIESSKKNLEATEGSFYRWSEVGTEVNLDNLTLTEGDIYDFTISTLMTIGGESNWVNVTAMPGKSNKVSVTKTASGYEITNYSPGNIEVSDFKVESATIYQNLPVKFSATFTNSNDVDLTRNYSAVFFDSTGKECWKMENYSVNVDADSSTDVDWTSVQWYKENDATDITEATTYTLKLYDNWQGEYVTGIEQTVTVLPEPKDSKVEATLSVEGAQKDGDVYVVDSSTFEVSITVKVLEGYFNSTINLGIEVPLSDGKYYTLMHRHFDAIPDLSEGEEQVWTMTMSVDDVEAGKIYRLQAWSNGGDLGKYIEIKFNTTTDGISSTESDTDYHVYSLGGVNVLNTKDYSRVRELPQGIYIINGKKVMVE